MISSANHIHQIWMQGWKYIPSPLKLRVDRNESLWGGTLHRWDEYGIIRLIESSFPEYLQWYNSIGDTITRCDISRAFILHEYGGLYADCDYDPKSTEMWKLLPSQKVFMGADGIFGANNAWILCSPRADFWFKVYIPYVKERLISPSTFDLIGAFYISTWPVLSTTGPFAIKRLADSSETLQLVPYEKVYKEWGNHVSDEPSWYKWSILRRRRLIMIFFTVFALIGFLSVLRILYVVM